MHSRVLSARLLQVNGAALVRQVPQLSSKKSVRALLPDQLLVFHCVRWRALLYY
jgi:hypothetical protein